KVGPHELVASSPGFTMLTKSFTATRGKTALVEVTLQPARIDDDPERAATDWALNKGGSVTLHGGRSLRKGDQLPAGQIRCQAVYLMGTAPVADDELVLIGKLQGIEELVLHGHTVSDEGVSHLKGLTTLRMLNLWHARLTDAGMAHLAGLKNLQDLHLD